MSPTECDRLENEAAALRQAIAGLLPFCSSVVLRRALSALVNLAEDARMIAARRAQVIRCTSTSPATAAMAEWDELRTRVAIKLEELRISRQELAATTQINFGTLRTYLAKGGPPAGAGIAQKLKAWLEDTVPECETIEDEAEAPEVVSPVPFQRNGAGGAAA